MSPTEASHHGLVPFRSTHDRFAAAIAHGGTCVAWFLAPLLVYVLERDKTSWVARQALSALLWSVIGTLATAVTCGLLLPLFLVVHVWAAIVVLRGEDAEYPLASDLARRLTA